MKDDEQALLNYLNAGENALEAVKDLRIPPKRAGFILEKWTERGWWEYGVGVFHGWLTSDGREEAERLKCGEAPA